MHEARVYNAACDACRIRKVKCDRGGAAVSKDGMDGTIEGNRCSYCTRQQVECTYLNAKRRRKIRPPVVEVGADNENHSPKDMSQSSRSSQRATIQAGSSVSPMNHIASPSTASRTSIKFSLLHSQDNLLGIEGLNRPLMDACFRGYYKFHAPCTSSLHADMLAARYSLYFAMLDRKEREGSLSSLFQDEAECSNNNDRPMSEVLLLAVGCVGAALLCTSIAKKGSKAKFRLQDEFALRFKQLLETDLLTRLEREETDIVEACYIMNDPFLSILNGQIRSVQTIDWTSLDVFHKLPIAERDPLTLNPATLEGIIRLVFKTAMHRQPTLRQKHSSNDPRTWESAGKRHLTEAEVFRRMRIFWSIFLADTFFSMGSRRCSLMTSEDYDWDLPTFIRRDDGDYNAVHVTRSKSSQSGIEKVSFLCHHRDHFTRFEVIQLEMLLRLAFIVRTIAMRFTGPRAQGRGVLKVDADRAVKALSAWFQHVPDLILWETPYNYLQQLSKPIREDEPTRKKIKEALQAFFVEIIYHRVVFTVFDCVDSYGLRDEIDLGEAMSSSIESNTQQRRTAEQSLPLVRNSIDLDKNNNCIDSNETYRPQKAKLEALMIQSFYRVAKIVKESADLNLLRANRLTAVLSCQCYATWGCKKASQIVKEASLSNQPIDLDQIKTILQAVEHIINALESIDSFEGAMRMASQLKQLLKTTREECRIPAYYQPVDSSFIEPPSTSMSIVDEIKSLAYTAMLDEQIRSDRKRSIDSAMSPDLNYLANQSMEWLQSYLQGRKEDDASQNNESNTLGNHLANNTNFTVTQENDLTAWLSIGGPDWIGHDNITSSIIAPLKVGNGVGEEKLPNWGGESLQTSEAQMWANLQWFNAL